MGLGLIPQNHSIYFPKILPLTISISWTSLMTKESTSLSKNYHEKNKEN